MIDLGSRLDDFMDSAAVMTNLDLVITPDTSVAHLAGALGVPVWVALPFAPDCGLAVGSTRQSVVSHAADVSPARVGKLERGLRANHPRTRDKTQGVTPPPPS